MLVFTTKKKKDIIYDGELVMSTLVQRETASHLQTSERLSEQ